MPPYQRVGRSSPIGPSRTTASERCCEASLTVVRGGIATAMTAVRFGLIGFGAWGGHHARAIAKTPGAELVAIAARSETTCAAAREQFPTAAVYSDYRQLLDHEQVDVVDVVLPSHLHAEVAKAVLESGRHLFMEKP